MKLPEIETDIPLIETILSPWQTALMADYEGYNRVKLIIAACFHDLGIWPESTIDYLPSSLALAKSYLEKRGRVDWEQEIILMIDMHHKLRAYKNPEFPLVEIFRQADLVDVSFGKIRKGIPKAFVAEVKVTFPNFGFHQRLRQLAWQQFKKKPFNPIPMMKW